MQRLIPRRTTLRILFWAICVSLVYPWLLGSAALAQQGGVHFGGPSHVSPPAPSHVLTLRPTIPNGLSLVGGRTRSFVVGPRIHLTPSVTIRPILANRVGAASLMSLRTHPILPPRWPVPIFSPILATPAFGAHSIGLFAEPSFGFGFGWRFNSPLWPNCDFLFDWEFGCNGLPAYDYGPGYDIFSDYPRIAEPLIETLYLPIYIYGDEDLRFVELYLTDGTVYNVTDYWLVNGQLHFKTLEENGTKLVEHTIEFDMLDLQKTLDTNTRRGFRFVLRNEPIDQYLQNHPMSIPPAPAPSGSAQPRQAPPSAPAEPGLP